MALARRCLDTDRARAENRAGTSMRTYLIRLLACGSITLLALPLSAQQQTPPARGGGAGQPAAAGQANRPRPEETEVYEPVPPVVTPGATTAAPPSDAIVL